MTASTSLIAATIADAPSWALIGFTMPDEQMRERGAQELARCTAERIHPALRRTGGSSACRSEPQTRERQKVVKTDWQLSLPDHDAGGVCFQINTDIFSDRHSVC